MLNPQELVQALSPERLESYSRDPADRDHVDAVARYIWNLALVSSFQPSLCCLEIAVRNAMFSASLHIVQFSGRYAHVKCWLDSNPSMLLGREAAAVQEAKDRLTRQRKPFTPGRLVARLGFGFWTGLCSRPYEHGRPGGPGLWPRLATTAFKHAPRSSRHRQAIADRLHSIRDFRNKLAHHEPIWDQGVSRNFENIAEAVGWVSPSLERVIRAEDQTLAIFKAGPAAFRAKAQSVCGV
jgi:hypothetical protein